MRDEGAWLLDMLLESRRIRRFVEGRAQDEFAQDEQAVYALVKAIENLGEAARQLLDQAPDIRARHPEIPWSDIIGMRNVLVHQYFRVKVGRVWKVANADVPRLISLLELLVPPEEQS
jgi:uncharacterized protein with HEPN domain